MSTLFTKPDKPQPLSGESEEEERLRLERQKQAKAASAGIAGSFKSKGPQRTNTAGGPQVTSPKRTVLG